MNITDYIGMLPEHWEVINVGDGQFDWWSDDGRDYDKPMFIRKDGKARIYFNERNADWREEYQFAISFDFHSDGDCYGDFAYAIKYADAYVEKNPVTW